MQNILLILDKELINRIYLENFNSLSKIISLKYLFYLCENNNEIEFINRIDDVILEKNSIDNIKILKLSIDNFKIDILKLLNNILPFDVYQKIFDMFNYEIETWFDKRNFFILVKKNA